MRNFITAIAALLAVSLISCKRNVVIGKGQSETESRNVSTFSRVHVSAKIKTIIHVDSTAKPSVSLDGYENVLSHIVTEVKDNTLHIRNKERVWLRSKKDIVATVTVPSLSYIGLTGAGDIHVDGYVNADNVEVDISGAGNVVIDHLNTQKLDAGLSGIGDLDIRNGNATHAYMRISGAGEIDADNVVCHTATVKVSGVGDVSVNVSERLDAKISGAGDIKYKGHPSITKHVSGVGDIEDNN